MVRLRAWFGARRCARRGLAGAPKSVSGVYGHEGGSWASFWLPAGIDTAASTGSMRGLAGDRSASNVTTANVARCGSLLTYSSPLQRLQACLLVPSASLRSCVMTICTSSTPSPPFTMVN